MKPQILTLLQGVETKQSDLARRDFAKHYGAATWKTIKPEAQARVMEGLLTSKASRPELVPAMGGAKPAPHKISGPTLIKQHAFEGIKADADKYIVTCGAQSVIVYAPHAPDKAKGHFHTIKEAAIAFATLPVSNQALIKSITLSAAQNPKDAYWATKYKDPNFRSYMTAGGAGEVTIYPSATGKVSQQVMNTSMIHETGHTWSIKRWGHDYSDKRWDLWKAAMAKDRISVSNYATNSPGEDVAETIRAYIDSKGTHQHAELRAMVPARFKILDPHF